MGREGEGRLGLLLVQAIALERNAAGNGDFSRGVQGEEMRVKEIGIG